MPYTKPYILTEKAWNNAFAWEERILKYNKNPSLTIPSCITGDIWDVQIGEEIVFEEVENDILKSCKGLKNFIRIQGNNSNKLVVWEAEKAPEIIVFDNHNHALYFWCEAIKKWILKPHFELIHIDEHSDLWENNNELDLDQARENLEYAWDFTNFSCNVGNYIQPALKCWLIKNMIRIENEYQIDEYMSYIPDTNSILNIDLDIFAPELNHIPEDKKIQIIRNLIQKVKYVTIATSPYFIEQWKALQMLEKILQK